MLFEAYQILKKEFTTIVENINITPGRKSRVRTGTASGQSKYLQVIMGQFKGSQEWLNASGGLLSDDVINLYAVEISSTDKDQDHNAEVALSILEAFADRVAAEPSLGHSVGNAFFQLQEFQSDLRRGEPSAGDTFVLNLVISFEAKRSRP